MKEYDENCIHGISVYESCSECRKAIDIFDQFEGDGAYQVLRTYLKLHEGKIGAHWLWCAIERITHGEREEQVLADYRYYRGVE